MPTYVNVAHRVRNLFQLASQQPPEIPTYKAWGYVFDIADPGGEPDPREVARMLNMLQDQLGEVSARMYQTDFPQELYSHGLNTLAAALDITMLAQRWEHYTHHISAIGIQTLGWCASAIEDREELIEEDALSQLAEDLERFEEQVTGGSLPDYAEAFVRDQIITIRQAAVDYPVIGAKAFRHAGVECLYELTENVETFAKHKDSDEMNRLKEFWNRLQTMAEKSGPWVALGQGFIRVLELASKSNG